MAALYSFGDRLADRAKDKAHSMLFSGAASGDIGIMEKALQDGADVNVHMSGHTPLHHAVLHNRLDSVKFLMNHGADTSAKAMEWDGSEFGPSTLQTPGEMAASYQHKDIQAYIARAELKTLLGHAPVVLWEAQARHCKSSRLTKHETGIR